MTTKLLFGSILNFVFNEIITHLPIHWVRKSFLRLFNKNIHSKSVVLMHVRILNFWKLKMDANSIVNQYCLLDCRRYEIKIDQHVDIGPYTRIWTLGHDPDSSDHALKGGDIYIGHHVWIASGVTILPNVRLAPGTVVAAASVVHKSTEQNDIIAGNPARFLRKRLNPLDYNIKYNPILE